MDLNKGVPTLFAYCEKLIWTIFFKFNQGTCPWMAFAWIFFFVIFLIFLGVCGGQIIYREYVVFRGSNVSCSLACSLVDRLEGLEWRGWRNRGREEVPFEDCAGKERMKEDRVLGLFLVQSLWSTGPRIGVFEEIFWVDVCNCKAVIDFV